MDINNIVIDERQYSKKTLASMQSACRLLIRNKIKMDRITLVNNFNNYIDTLKTRNGKPISLGYKWSIYNTLKRLFPEDIIEHNLEKITSTPKLNDLDLVKNIKPFITNYIIKKFIENLSQSLVEYETCLICLLTICTGLRITEILNITLTDWEKLYKDGVIVVKSKRLVERKVYKVDLLKKIYELDEKLDTQKRRWIEQSSIKSTKYIKSREKYFIKSSYPNLIRTLNIFWKEYTYMQSTIGPNVLRKFITTMLAEDFDLSVMFNMHTNPQTTATYYTYIDGIHIDASLKPLF